MIKWTFPLEIDQTNMILNFETVYKENMGFEMGSYRPYFSREFLNRKKLLHIITQLFR